MKICRTEGEIRGLLREWLIEMSKEVIARNELGESDDTAYRWDSRTITDVCKNFVDNVANCIRGMSFNDLLKILYEEVNNMRSRRIYFPFTIYRILSDNCHTISVRVENAMKTEEYKTEVKRKFVNKFAYNEKERFLQLLMMFDEEDEIKDVMSLFREVNIDPSVEIVISEDE